MRAAAQMKPQVSGPAGPWLTKYHEQGISSLVVTFGFLGRKGGGGIFCALGISLGRLSGRDYACDITGVLLLLFLF